MHMVKRRSLNGLWLMVVLFAAGCTAAIDLPTTTPQGGAGATATPTVLASGDQVVAEAVVEPALWAPLSFTTSGVVKEILVHEGDVVKKGQVLVRLDDTDAQLAVKKAEAVLAAAEARLAKLKAGARPEEIAVARAQLDAARAELSQATARRDQVYGGGAKADVAQAQAEVEQARATEWAARDLYNREGWQMGDAATTQLRAAEAALAAAEARLVQAEAGGTAQQSEAKASVWAASSQQKVAQAQLDLQLAGASASEIAVSEAEVESARVDLEVAKAALTRYEIEAPFDGVVTTINVKVGSRVVPDGRVCAVATVDNLQVRTTDLTELSVGRLAIGHPVEIRVDAFPELVLKGKIFWIGLESESRQGDVTYPVTVVLDEKAPAGLRWGMTSMVTIQIP